MISNADRGDGSIGLARRKGRLDICEKYDYMNNRSRKKVCLFIENESVGISYSSLCCSEVHELIFTPSEASHLSLVDDDSIIKWDKSIKNTETIDTLLLDSAIKP